MRFITTALALTTLCVLSASGAEKPCSLGKLGELPATMVGTQPIVSGTINGTPLRFLIDSGAFFSVLSRDTAQRLQLHEGPLPFGMTLNGVGGSESAGLATAKEFALAGLLGGHIFNRVEFIVSSTLIADDVDGLIGQNVLRIGDTEYDLANGVLRLMRAENCSDHSLAYWHGGNSVAELHIETTTPASPHWISEAKINGRKIRVLFDSGASHSLLDSGTAAKLGIKPESVGVQAAGVTSGVGPHTVELVYARFDTLDLGGELIKNARLFVGDLSRVSGIDLLLGADFFLSHRMYFSAKQNKLYFTYNGGPVFDLRAKAYADTSKPIATDTQSASAAETPALSAADLRRRGAASASRGDFQRAMVDFDQAIRLDSADAENFYERGTAYASTAQLQQAVADFDKHLKSGRDISVLCWRAEQYVCRKKIKPQRMPILMQSCILAKMIPTIS